jgi:hypothetical protein
VCIARAVEESSDLGEVLQFWMEFAEFGDVCIRMAIFDGHMEVSCVGCSQWFALSIDIGR